MFNLLTANNNLDEVVFANRNKAYGAYQIRKQYNNAVTRSLGIVLGVFLLLFLASQFFRNALPISPKSGPVTTTKCDFPEVIFDVIIPEIPSVAGPKSSVDAPPKIVPDKKVQVVREVKTTFSSGVSGTSSIGSSALSNSTSGLPSKLSFTRPSTTPKIYDQVEDMPQFIDGDLESYLNAMLVYPTMALENQVSGVVEIVFEVDETGQVTHAMVAKSVGFGCDEEALRVVKLMPKWKPGMQNGAAVPVRLKLPIRFSK